MEPQIRYCTSADGTRIAYMFREDGRLPAVFYINYLFLPIAAHGFGLLGSDEYIGSERQMLRMDRRGIGYSQREVTDFSLDTQVADVLAVATQAGLSQFDVAGFGDGCWVAAAFAARHPERVRRMFLSTPTMPGADSARQSIANLARSSWTLARGTIADIALGGAADAEARSAYIRYLAEATSPETAASYLDVAWNPIEEVGSITAPTLVISTRRRLSGGAAASQALAAAIPGARLIATQGGDIQAAYYGAREFLSEDEPAAPGPKADPAGATFTQSSGGLQTIVFTDIEANTELLQRLGDERWRTLLREQETIIRTELARHGGAEIKTMGDAFMASFASAARALECAVDLQRAFAEHNTAAEHPLQVRIGINAGEPIAEADDLFGTSVTMTSRIMGHARGGEVLVSDVVRQLVAGKGFLFADRGESVLRGFEDPVRLWQLRLEEGG